LKNKGPQAGQDVLLTEKKRVSFQWAGYQIGYSVPESK